MSAPTQPSVDPEQFRRRQRELHQLSARVESLKEYLVSLDKRKQSNRMVRTELRKRGGDKGKPAGKIWLATGEVFLKMSQEEAAGIMGEDDIQIENEIQTAREELKTATLEMEQVAGRDTASSAAFSTLKSMSSKEVDGMLGAAPRG
eukprot:CAMPEP_0180117518 /NCGR_PEP_ID=MMETSP0986-20121125/963_1 /TAXON_ID=697907 /ORGANISM="non described non described, Strain CCMP2293" /LENGTH=146 /DNA_ID=CAMNT_0022056401 /DNA_START=19 /DNA_END=459 /DNA_ORIENTATION=+